MPSREMKLVSVTETVSEKSGDVSVTMTGRRARRDNFCACIAGTKSEAANKSVQLIVSKKEKEGLRMSLETAREPKCANIFMAEIGQLGSRKKNSLLISAGGRAR